MSKKTRTCKKNKPENPKGITVGDIVMSTCEAKKMFNGGGCHDYDNAKVLECSFSTCLVELVCGCRSNVNYHWIYPKKTFSRCCCCCHK